MPILQWIIDIELSTCPQPTSNNIIYITIDQQSYVYYNVLCTWLDRYNINITKYVDRSLQIKIIC